LVFTPSTFSMATLVSPPAAAPIASIRLIASSPYRPATYAQNA
jgi:hypothetical protein